MTNKAVPATDMRQVVTRFTAIGPQDGPAALIAVAAGGIAGSFTATADPDSIFSMVVAAILGSSNSEIWCVTFPIQLADNNRSIEALLD